MCWRLEFEQHLKDMTCTCALLPCWSNIMTLSVSYKVHHMAGPDNWLLLGLADVKEAD